MTTSETRGTRNEIERAILDNQGIADVSALREAILPRVPFPVDWQVQDRDTHLRPFAPLFERILDPVSENPRMRALVGRLAQTALSRQCAWPVQEPRPTPPAFDPRFNDAEDLLPLIFAVIFQDRRAGLLGQWMSAIDAHVKASSRANLEAMDQARLRQETPLRKEVVLVGGGPLTSLVASILGPYFHLTVITMERDLGKPWRNRQAVRLNSSCSIRDFNGPSLPLLGGPTTRAIAGQRWNDLDVDLLLGTDTLTVACANGSTVEYVPGPRLGDLVATDIVLHADDYLVGQRVDVSRLQRNDDGSLRLTLIDEDDRTVRLFDAAAVFLLTGPGPEQSKIPDAASQQRYQAAAEVVDRAIREARRALAQELAALGQLETAADFPDQESLREVVRRKRSREVATRIAWDIGRRLPRLLTLTSLEKVYDVWAELEALGAGAESFPLADLVAGGKSLAFIGNGDTARVLKEWADGVGPESAYPRGLRRARPRRATIYNEASTSPKGYARSNRPRYADVFTPTTRAIQQKASRYRFTYDRRGEPRMEVTHLDASGARRRRIYDYVFDATGLSRRGIEAQLPAAFRMEDVRDLEGYVVARGAAGARLYIAGAATGFRGPDFPPEIQRILQALSIGENTISLWINGLLAERLAYTYLATQPLTKTWPQRAR